MSDRGLLARVDDAILPRLRRVAEAVVAPVRRLRRWEADPERGRVVRGVRRRPSRVAVAAGLVVLIGGAVQLQRFPELTEQRQAGDAAALASDEVGPRVGTDLEAYVSGRHDVLDDYDGSEVVRAVVSFTAAHGLDDLPLPDDVDVEVVQLVVPAQELEPRQLDLRTVDDPDDVLGRFLAGERAALDEEIAELASTLEEDLGDPDFEADFERRLIELREARERLDDDLGLVFAAVVVAPAVQLRALRDDQAAIRAVDPAGPANRTTDARFHGILPSDDERASTGRPL